MNTSTSSGPGSSKKASEVRGPKSPARPQVSRRIPWREPILRLWIRPLSAGRMAHLCHELRMTYDAGIPLLRGLEVIAAHHPSRTVRRILAHLRYAIRQGATLSDAVYRHRLRFPRFFVELVAGAEASGSLGRALRHLEDHYQDQVRLQRKAITAAVYPLGILFVARYLIPLFEATMRNAFLGAGIDLGRMVQRQALDLALVILGCVLLVRLGVVRAVWNVVGPHLPPFDAVARRLALARFFRALGLFLESGLGSAKSVEAAAAVCGNPFIERALRRSVPRIREGRSFHESLRGLPYLDPESLAFVDVGERAGRMDEALAQLAEHQQAAALFRVRALLVTGTFALFFAVVFASFVLGGIGILGVF